VEPVGSTSTLVWSQIERTGHPIPGQIAALLLAGIYSDTLILTSPTTTDREREAVKHLIPLAFATDSPLAGQVPEEFGRELLRAGAGLESRAPRDVVRSDLKDYDAGGHKFGVAQVEVADEPDISSHIPALRDALGALCGEKGFGFAVLMITEVVTGSSRILIHTPPPPLSDLPYRRLQDGSLDAPGVVSRKKQLLPTILSLLER